MTNPEIPDIVIGRLPLYLRALNRMMQEGHDITSSHELGDRLGISSAQIRKDLSHFGEFGKQGTGYQISFLSEQLQIILNVNKEWSIALVGVGHLGRALAGYAGFQDRGYRIIAAFDNESSKIGEKINSLDILGLDQLHTVVKKLNILMAMLAVPASHAQAVTDDLVDAGIQAILNYAPINITVPKGIRVQYIDPVTHLQRMTYYLPKAD